MTCEHKDSEDPNSKDAVDPEYRIAYDVVQCKAGCVLIQAALGGDVPRDLFFRYFGTDTWTVSTNGCEIYRIRQSQLAARTNKEAT